MGPSCDALSVSPDPAVPNGECVTIDAESSIKLTVVALGSALSTMDPGQSILMYDPMEYLEEVVSFKTVAIPLDRCSRDDDDYGNGGSGSDQSQPPQYQKMFCDHGTCIGTDNVATVFLLTLCSLAFDDHCN